VGFAVTGLSQCFQPAEAASCAVRTDQRGPTVSCGADCPGLPHCLGVPAAYTALFGQAELKPPPIVPGALAMEDLQGSSREVRMRMVRLSARASILRITSVDHPDAAALLREAGRLGFRRVEVVADLAPLAAFSDDELLRLRRLTALTPVGPTPEGLLERIARITPDVELPSTS
jgi:hypothetical protein